MYCQFYGFKELPFNVTSDPDFFYLTTRHQEALSHLLYGVSQRKGIIVITGEVGTGKTTLCRFFLNQLGARVKTALILNPYFSEIQLLEAIIRDFGIPTRTSSRLKLGAELNEFLLRESRMGHNVVLIIDEAQNLKTQVLEQVRLLSNLETEKDKLLQVILSGQPELNDKLQLHELRQLRQRVMVKYHITPLAGDEIKGYIYHRLGVANPNHAVQFTDDAVLEIERFSRGTPRIINMICDRCLLAAFVAGTPLVDRGIVVRSIEEAGVEPAGELH